MVDKYKQLDYLSLEIKATNRIQVEQSSYLCFASGLSEHCLHSSDPHLNFLTDIVLLLSKQNQVLHQQVERNSVFSANKYLREISEKLEYIRASRESIQLKHISTLSERIIGLVDRLVNQLEKFEGVLTKLERQLL